MGQTNRQRWAGFTLVELLVVIAVIGLLMALLLPAVMAARESARRAKCQNHLRQIALGITHYHDTHRSFPYGAAGGWGHSWHAFILAFVEQGPLADTVPWTESGWWRGPDARSEALRRLARAPIRVFRCPSQPGPHQWRVNGLSGRQVSSYSGNVGSNVTSDNLAQCQRGNGALIPDDFRQDRTQPPPRISEVLDGVTHTLLVGEVRFVLDEECNICDRFYNYSPNIDNRGGGDFSEVLASTSVGINLKGPGSSQRKKELAFGSFHPYGANVAMVDGSIRFVSADIDLETWKALGSRSGSERATNHH